VRERERERERLTSNDVSDHSQDPMAVIEDPSVRRVRSGPKEGIGDLKSGKRAGEIANHGVTVGLELAGLDVDNH